MGKLGRLIRARDELQGYFSSHTFVFFLKNYYSIFKLGIKYHQVMGMQDYLSEPLCIQMINTMPTFIFLFRSTSVALQGTVVLVSYVENQLLMYNCMTRNN